MAYISKFELFAIDLPFRKSFKHAASERKSSSSVFVKCVTDSGEEGFGECLPREYVTGETRDVAFELLHQKILPKLLGIEFKSLKAVKSFLIECDGKAPKEWIEPEQPQTAAWCAVDLALLDAFGKSFNAPIRLGDQNTFPEQLRYSAVISADTGLKLLKTLLKIRLYGIRQVKLKVGSENINYAVGLARRLLGKTCDIRVDSNMIWDVEQAFTAMHILCQYGVHFFEQPIAADDIDGLARLVRETNLDVMVDESLSDRASLDELIYKNACTAVNVRISKCGGLMASLARCREALDAGLKLQLGCQVGESSLLSAAQIILIKAVRQVTYVEGCYGLHLLQEDPAQTVLQFGYGGTPPDVQNDPGIGIAVNESVLKRWTIQHETIDKS